MEKILFFDGVCVMCNGLVDFVLKHDTKHIFYFAPLQGTTAERVIPELSSQRTTVVLYEGSQTYTESDAIIRLLVTLGGWFRLFAALKIIPKFIRDASYRWIAKNRYRWFGKNEHCRLPSPEERGRILD